MNALLMIALLQTAATTTITLLINGADLATYLVALIGLVVIGTVVIVESQNR